MDSDVSILAPDSRGHASPSGDPLPSFLHDLNNLLGIVLGNTELLQDGRDNQERARKRLHAIHTAAAKARDLAAALPAQLNGPR